MTAKQIGTEIIFNLLGSSGGKFLGLVGKKALSRYRNLGCLKNSFINGTLVHTKSGLVPIENISIGDLVWATNPDTGQSDLKTVTHLIQGKNEYLLVDITFSDGNSISSTLEHPFYANNQWVDAVNLEEGDKVFLLDKAINVVVKKVEFRSKTIKVYNLTVSDFHTFHIGDSGYLVHNTSCILDPATHNIEKASPKLTSKVRGYPANTHVYLGFDLSGNVVCAGISGDVRVRGLQHARDGRSFKIIQITRNGALPKPLARAIEQAFINKYGLGGKQTQSGQLQNKINSIAELRDWYDEALVWGNKWIKNNSPSY